MYQERHSEENVLMFLHTALGAQIQHEKCVQLCSPILEETYETGTKLNSLLNIAEKK